MNWGVVGCQQGSGKHDVEMNFKKISPKALKLAVSYRDSRNSINNRNINKLRCFAVVDRKTKNWTVWLDDNKVCQELCQPFL